MERKMLLIYNPVSGKAHIKTYLNDIITILTSGNFCVTVHPTRCARDGYDYIKSNYGSYDVICVCGGDGMLNEAVSALMTIDKQNRPLFSYLPAGSTNDFAGTIGLPLDLREAAKALVDGAPFVCDAGAFNEKYFAYVAAFGAFTSVAYDTSQEFKNIFGHMAYIMEGIMSLPTIKPHHMKIKFDGGEIEDDFLFGMITNSLQVGGMKHSIAKAISLNDGLFEVVLIKKPQKPTDIQNMITSVLKQDFDCNGIVNIKASKITFESDEAVSWTLDGEFGGEIKKAEITNIPRGFSVIV